MPLHRRERRLLQPDHTGGSSPEGQLLHAAAIPVGTMGVPNGDPFETNFTTGQRNIFRQSWQRRADASLTKTCRSTTSFILHYSFDMYTSPSPLVSIFHKTRETKIRHSTMFLQGSARRGCAARRQQQLPDQSLWSQRWRSLNCPAGLGITKTRHRQRAPGSDVAASGLLRRATRHFQRATRNRVALFRRARSGTFTAMRP